MFLTFPSRCIASQFFVWLLSMFSYYAISCYLYMLAYVGTMQAPSRDCVLEVPTKFVRRIGLCAVRRSERSSLVDDDRPIYIWILYF